MLGPCASGRRVGEVSLDALAKLIDILYCIPVVNSKTQHMHWEAWVAQLLQLL